MYLSGLNDHSIQLVTGTCGRPNALQQMIESARVACDLPGLLSFIVVDCCEDANGETERYCRAQPDVLYIRQPGRRGAIAAFNLGCAHAGAAYVLLANDDIVFEPFSITRAWRYLEDNPEVGAVAFMDDRRAPFKQQIEDKFGVQLIIDHTGDRLIYAQVGLFRRWLGDLAGWWGRDDPIFLRHAHTYGGDNYLSARIYELGYRIEAVQGVRVHDRMLVDTLRENNYRIERANPSAYYVRYPSGFKRAASPRVRPSAVHQPLMRILYLPIYEPGVFYTVQKQQKRGLRRAFSRIGLCVERDYLNDPQFDLLDTVRAFRPDLLFIQLHDAQRITARHIRAVRQLAPETLVVTWNGDVYPENYISPEMLDVLGEVDLVLGVNLDALEEVERLARVPVRYWQVAFEPALDKPLTEEYDLVFLGNRYSGRDALDDFLKRRGATVAGSGWSFPTLPNSTYNFQMGRDLYRSAKAALGDNVHGARGFVSNRMFEALAAGGALYFQQSVPELERLTGLRAGEHYIEWTDFADLDAKLNDWLVPARARLRRQIADRAARFVRRHHSFDARVRELLTFIQELK